MAAASSSPIELSPELRTASWKSGESPPGTPPVQPKGKAKAKPSPRKRPLIDIDEQISEANHLAHMLKKVQTCARTCKKNGQRSKKRLMAKAARLSEHDLERIATIKKLGMFAVPVDATAAPPAPKVSKLKEPKHSAAAVRGAIAIQLQRFFEAVPDVRPKQAVPSSEASTEEVPATPPGRTQAGTIRASRLPSGPQALENGDGVLEEKATETSSGKDHDTEAGLEEGGDLERSDGEASEKADA